MNLSRLSHLLTYFLFLAHLIACAWWVIGSSHEGDDDGLDDGRGESWLKRPGRKGYVLDADSDNAETLGQKYWSSLYWSLTTLMKTAWIPVRARRAIRHSARNSAPFGAIRRHSAPFGAIV